MEMEAQNAENEDDIPDYYRQFDDPMNGDRNGMMHNESELNKQPSISAATTPHPTLPWEPKVRQKDIYQFMDISRKKFIGYSLPDNCETTAGLPNPICEGINILKRVSSTFNGNFKFEFLTEIKNLNFFEQFQIFFDR